MILTATINEVKRRILFDNPQAVVAVKGDYEVNGIAFAFPAIYEDDFDLSTAVKTVYYKATDGIIYNHVVTATDTDTGYPLWVFKDEINKGAFGDVEFALVCDKVEGGNIVKRWVSMITAFRVQKSIEIDESEQEENEQTYSERLAYLMTQMANMQTSVTTASESASAALTKANAVDARLNNIIIESGTSEAEVVAARTNSDTGTTYNTLGARLDTEYSEIKEDLDDVKDAIAVEYPVNATWTRGYIKPDGTTSADYKSCYTDYIKSNGNDIIVKMGSGYRSKVAHYNSSKTFVEMLYDSSTYNKTISIPKGDYVRIQVSSDNTLRPDDITNSVIAISSNMYLTFADVILGSTADFNDLTETGTYRVPSAYVASYTNCPTTDYGRLIVFNSTSDGYSCVQIYISYNNKVYTRILQVLNTSTWSTWMMLGGDAYLHDGDILRMASDPEAIPVGSEHLGYTAFMAATWETLLPSEYTDGDSYDASTTKIINIHVSRESNWQSTAYGSNTDTYPIYRYIFTPVNGYEKTVFLSAGCHGNEAEGYWGLYRLMRMIYFEGYKYPTLRNLRDNVRFIIVPCWNPWGMQNYRRYNAFESNNLQAYRWFYATDNTITVDGTDYSINDVGEAKVIWDTITNYSDVIDLWLEIHTDPYAGRTTSAGEIDDPRGYTQPYGCYGFVKRNSRVHYRLQAVMEDFYNILLGEYNFTEKWHLVSSNGDASGAGGYSPWMASLGFPTALVEISTFMNGFPHASGSAGMMKLAQEYYANCLAELIR